MLCRGEWFATKPRSAPALDHVLAYIMLRPTAHALPMTKKLPSSSRRLRGVHTQFGFQIAERNEDLGAVSYMVDHRHKVVFDQDEQEKDMSYMLHKPSGDIFKLRRDRNVWVSDSLVEDEEDIGEFAAGFTNRADMFVSQASVIAVL